MTLPTSFSSTVKELWERREMIGDRKLMSKNAMSMKSNPTNFCTSTFMITY